MSGSRKVVESRYEAISQLFHRYLTGLILALVVETGPDRDSINPLIHWDRAALESYAKVRELPLNPLYDQGFLSIGCAPCTRAVRSGEHPRTGRWPGMKKTECGLWQSKA